MFDGLAKPQELIEAAIKKNIAAIALTDHGNMNGTADLYKAAAKYEFKVKHIFGNEFYYVKDLKQWNEKAKEIDEDLNIGNVTKECAKELRRTNNRYNHAIFLAKNQLGLENLFEMTFLSHKFGFYRKPRIDRSQIEKLSDGVVTTSACVAGPLSTILWEHHNKAGKINIDLIREELEWWHKTFGENYFLELQFNELPWQDLYNKALIEIHKETKIPLIVTSDVHYIEQRHSKLQTILRMIENNKLINVDDEELAKATDELFNSDNEFDDEVKCENLYLKNAEEVLESAKLFSPDIDIKIVKEAIDNTYQISQQFETIHLNKETKIPAISSSENNKKLSEDECMELLVNDALKILKDMKLSKDDNKKYLDRLKEEIHIIKTNKLATYFYIIHDIYKNGGNDQLHGPGRGSCGGSLLLYLLGIVDLDPIKYNIMLQRFIDLSRVEMPDIDMDWAYPDKIKEYMKKKYGEDNIAYVASYSTFSFRNLIKDLGRIFGHSFDEMNKVSSGIFKEVRNIHKLPEFSDQDKSTINIDYDILSKYSKTFAEFVKDKPELDEAFRIFFGKIRNTCITGNTDVLTKDGLKKVIDIDINDEIVYVNEKGEVLSTNEFNIFESGYQEYFEIHVGNSVLELTGNHVVFTKCGMKRVDELTCDDELLQVVV